MNHCTTDHSCCSNKDPRSHPGSKSNNSSGDMEGLKRLNVLNSLNFSRDHTSRSDKSKPSKTSEGKTQGNGETDRVGVSNAGNSEEELRRGKMVEESGERRVTPSGDSLQNGNCISEVRSINDLLRQSSSHCLLLGKMDGGDMAKKAKAKEAPLFMKSLVANNSMSEAREPSPRVEEGMKPVTISSEEGMRTILASPLLQAELAKNKPLQKLFMQAVQQQKQSREKQELRAAAAAASTAAAEAEARSQCTSTEQTLNVQGNQHQQRSLSKPDPNPGNKPQQAADQSGGKQKPQITLQGRTKGACKLPTNQPQSSASLGLKPQVILSQSNPIPGGKMTQPAVHSSLAKEGKTPQEPCKVSEGKPQQPQTLSHCSSTQANQAAANGKARHKQQQQQQQMFGSSSGNKDQQSSGAAPKGKLQSQNPSNRKQTNGLLGSHDEALKRPTVDVSHGNTFQNGQSLSSNGLSANVEVQSKSENKKTSVGYKKNKKSGGPPAQIVEDEARPVLEAAKIPNGDKKSNLAADANNRTRTVVNCAPQLETYMTNDHLQRINSSTVVAESSDAASENNQVAERICCSLYFSDFAFLFLSFFLSGKLRCKEGKISQGVQYVLSVNASWSK